MRISPRSHLIAALAVLLACAAGGCGQGGVTPPPVPPGGNGPPVTAARLQSHTLEHIRLPVTWQFDGAKFTVTSSDGPLPADVAEPLIGANVEAETIHGWWKLNADGDWLELTEIQAGDRDGFNDVILSIGPAGPIRVNIGSEQYNLLKKQAP